MEAFTITAVTSTSIVWWHLDMHVVIGNERRTVRVDDDGRPFATTPARPGLRWKWTGDSWQARDLPPGVPAPRPVAPGQLFPREPQP